MRKKSEYLGLLFIILICLSSAGVGKMFIQRNSSRGNLVYIFEQKMGSNSKVNSIKNIKYDYTYLSDPDSVTFLSTIVLKNPATSDSIIFSNKNLTYSSPTDIIFVEPKGKNFTYRLRARLPFRTWKEFYKSIDPFSVTYVFKHGEMKYDYSFGYEGKQWLDNRHKMNEIINIIELNKNK